MSIGIAAAQNIKGLGNISGPKDANMGVGGAKSIKEPKPVAISDEMAFQRALKQPPKPVEPSAEGTIGKEAISKIQDVKSSFVERVDNINKLVSSSQPLDSQAYLKVQWEMSNLLIQTDFTNKIASGVNEKVDTLLKTQ